MPIFYYISDSLSVIKSISGLSFSYCSSACIKTLVTANTSAVLFSDKYKSKVFKNSVTFIILKCCLEFKIPHFIKSLFANSSSCLLNKSKVLKKPLKIFISYLIVLTWSTLIILL